ncbi:MAG: sugar phosphate nucleotidyltransferase [Prevotella sp.]|nr:sugar phosphate nucleotidyltransferase [Prevotella sp.]MCM1474743.1 sugar phosphate nucleotidyltransferase [Muribaculaceae bacterium]
MKAFILAAGLGTRLKPWTLSHPKALVPVGGIPMLERVIVSLINQGFDRFVVNVHHFAPQIVEFLQSRDFGVPISISDESAQLLNTGGAILQAAPLLAEDDEPFLIHNVDILTNVNPGMLMHFHEISMHLNTLSTLLVSRRESSRKLVFNQQMELRGWHNLSTDEFRPEGFHPVSNSGEVAFSGIHVMSPTMIDIMRKKGYQGAFSIMDFLLDVANDVEYPGAVKGMLVSDMDIIDIGKPEMLEKANRIFTNL